SPAGSERLERRKEADGTGAGAAWLVAAPDRARDQNPAGNGEPVPQGGRDRGPRSTRATAAKTGQWVAHRPGGGAGKTGQSVDHRPGGGAGKTGQWVDHRPGGGAGKTGQWVDHRPG